MSNEQYLTDLFIYQAESLAASDVDMIDGDDFEIEYDGGHCGDVSISGLMTEALKRLRKVEAERDALAAHVGELVKGGRALHDELQQWSLTERDPETSAAMAAWRSVVNENPDNSSARLHFRIQELETSGNGLYVAFEALLPGLKHIALQDYSVINEAPIRWARAVSATDADALAHHDARIKVEALEELAAQPGMEHFTASRAVEALAAKYRKQAEGVHGRG